MRARWADEESRAKLEQSLRKPEARAKLSEASRGRVPSPESREKNRQSQLARWSGDAAAREKMAQLAKDMWADPERRAALQESLEAVMASPETRQKLSEARVRWLADPVNREWHSNELRRRWKDPEYRRKMIDLQRAPWEDSPEWFGPFLDRLALVEMFREQDGDLCQLCLEPIDFGVTWPDVGYPSLDHIRPRACGGTDDPDNLWLAHCSCNASKGARHVGREDGSTDRRKASDGSPAAGARPVAGGDAVP